MTWGAHTMARGDRPRLAVVGAVVVTALTVASAGASTTIPMGGATGTAPRSPTPGFLLDRGRYTTIEVPGATVETGAGGINNRGQVVGQYQDANGRFHGYVWERGRFGPSTPPARPGPRCSTSTTEGRPSVPGWSLMGPSAGCCWTGAASAPSLPLAP
jgi:probable HAF family extracellular repeat protein